MLYGLLEELYHLNPKITFAILSPTTSVVVPPEVKDKTKFVKPSLFVVAKGIISSSAFLIGGGTHLSDYGNRVVEMLKIQLIIFLLALLAKILDKKIYVLGNGIGPFQTALGAVLPRLTLHLADYISVRDKASYNLLTEWELKSKTYLAFDLSVLIKTFGSNMSLSAEKNRKVLGISVTPAFELYYGSKEKDRKLINEISKCINDLLKREPQTEVWLFIFHGQSRDDDVSITRELQKKIKPQDHVKLIPYNPDPKKVISKVSQCDAFIGMKYHSCVFAYIAKIPLLIIAYHPKCYAFAKEIGLSEKAVISLDEILRGHFAEYLKNLQAHPEDFLPTLPLETAKKRAKNGFPKEITFLSGM